MDMKKLSKHHIKTYAWLVLLTVLTGVTLTAARFQADELITGVEAEVVLLDKGNNLIQPEEFVTMVAKKFGPMKGLPIDMVDMRSVEEYLLTNPYVRQADVYLGANGTLMMTLHQRMPLMRVVDNSGRHWYIDTDTVMMPVSRFFTARVPLVNGDFPATTDVKQWPVDDLFRITEMLQEDEFMGSLIDQVYVEAPEKIWLVPRMGPTRILIGNTNELEDKAERIQKMYKEALPATGWDTYSYIDTRFAGQVVAKKRLNQ
jgi:cell division protein FtsQ